MIGGHGLQQPSWGVSQLLVNGGRTCDAGCRDEVHLQLGQMVSNMSMSSSSLLAAVDQELANCRYVARLDMGGADNHIINLMAGEALVTITSQD